MIWRRLRRRLQLVVLLVAAVVWHVHDALIACGWHLGEDADPEPDDDPTPPTEPDGRNVIRLHDAA